MALDDLLERLARRDAGTSGTSHVPADVPANPLQTLAGTSGTSGTSEKDKGGSDSSETPPIRAPRWLIHFPDREPLELHTAPPMTHAAILAAYPGAVAAEPVPERVTRAATVIERAELLALIQAIYAAATDQDRQEAADAALADPEGALQCYRAIANERGIVVALPKVAGAVAGCNAKSAPAGCSTCRHRRRPGRADPGYCSGRDDLPPAYGLHHPLRRLPDDQGATCTSYQTIED